jgi:predicted O-methyltransferase YrrM
MKKDLLSALPIVPEEFEAEHLKRIDFSRLRSEMNEVERLFINGLIRYYQPENILEVGVAKGAGTVNILNAISDSPSAKLVSIDRMAHYYRDKNVLVGSDVNQYADVLLASDKHKGENRWKLIAGKEPSEVMDQLGVSFDFLVLDTTHALPGEVLGFLTLLPYLKDGAIVVIHDIALFVRSYSSIASSMLFSLLVGEKLVPKTKTKFSNSNSEYFVNNIGAVQVNADTRKYINNVFQALVFPWLYCPASDISVIRQLLSRHYNEAEIACFDHAVELNTPFTLTEVHKFAENSIRRFIKYKIKKTISKSKYLTKLFLAYKQREISE